MEIHRLGPPDHSFLAALARGATLVDALEAAADADAKAEVASLLARYVALGAIVGFAVGAR